MRTVKATLTPYVYNEAFTVLHGGEFFVDGRIVFPEVPQTKPETMGVDGTYRTVYGPSVAHTGNIYGNTNFNVAQAASRILAARGSLDLERKFLAAQETYVNNNLPFLHRIRATTTHHAEPYTNMIDELEEHYDDPHAKKQLRIGAFEDLSQCGYKGVSVTDRLWLAGRVLYKLKKDEIAKFGKPPRMIGDLGVAASLQGFRITKMMKNSLASNDIEYAGGTMTFCKRPTPEKLIDIFKNLLEPKGRYYFAYFSDDSCISFRDKKGDVQIYNLDIKKCDASHGSGIFKALLEITPEYCQDDMRVLIEQCTLPIQIIDLNDKNNKVILAPKTPRLYSGSTITTLINNLANILICKSIVDNPDLDGPKDIALAAAQLGYILTCEPCEQPQDIQFLKHSPAYDTNGQLQAMLNIGVLLRASGTCRGDLPGKKNIPLKTRAMTFQRALLRGMYPRTHTPLLTNMINACTDIDEKLEVKATERINKRFSYKIDVSADTAHAYFTNEETFKRYRLTPKEISSVVNGFGNGTFETSFACSGLEKILKLDYGLSCAYAA